MSSAPHPRTAEWTRQAERGSLPLVRFMAWASVLAGRSVSRVLLYPTTAYYFLTSTRARCSSRAFLRRALGREPTLADVWRIFMAFSTTIHDRIFFLKGRFEDFQVEVRGAGIFDNAGTLLMGAHVGSFEALRACGRGLGGRRVAMAMYEDNARRLNAILAALEPSAALDIIPLGRVESMLQLESRLAAGDLVGMLADRSLGDEPAVRVAFLGEEARFPVGPMRIAAALRARVVFMAGLYRGGNRYEILFEPLADFSGLDTVDRAERRRLVENGVRAYASRLETLCRSAPDNWFNFHDFWK